MRKYLFLISILLTIGIFIPTPSEALNFGYETVGGTNSDWTANYIHGLKASITENGTGNSISYYGYDTGEVFKCALYKTSDNSFVGGTSEGVLPAAGAPAWITVNFTDSPSLISGTEYYISYWSATVIRFFYDVVTGASAYDSETYGVWPNPMVPTAYNNKFSIYATYTAEEEVGPTGPFQCISGECQLKGNVEIK